MTVKQLKSELESRGCVRPRPHPASYPHPSPFVFPCFELMWSGHITHTLTLTKNQGCCQESIDMCPQ